MEDRLEYCEPGKKYVSQVLNEALIVRVETTFYSIGNGTKMNRSGRERVKYCF